MRFSGSLLLESFSWVEKKSVKKNYPFFLALSLVCVSLFLAFPRYDIFFGTSEAWDVTMLKTKDLTNSLEHISPESFMAKKVFRLSVPLVIRIFHLNIVSTLVIQYILGYLLILFSYKFAYRILRDAVSASFFAAGITFLYYGRACFTELTYTWFDGWAYFFLLMAAYNRNLILIFLFGSLAAWTDERAFMALPIIILFHQLNYAESFSNKQLLTPAKPAISVIAAMICYLGIRFLLSQVFDMHTPQNDANWSIFIKNVSHTSFGFGAFTFLEGFWLLLPLSVYIAVKRKHFLFLFLLLSVLGISFITALFVMDITRSGSYMGPILFIFLLYLSRLTERTFFRAILFICMFFAFIFPPMNYIAFGDFEFRIEKPFLWVLLSLIQGREINY